MNRIKTCEFSKSGLLSLKGYRVISKITKGKCTKILIKLLTGVLIVVVLTVSGGLVSTQTVHASGVNNKYTIEDINLVFGNNEFIGGVVGNAIHNNSGLVANINSISRETGCTDVKWLGHIASQEKSSHLQKGELFSLIFGEGEFKHDITRMDGGSLSYGSCQMKKGTADMAYNYLKAKGVSIQKPTETLLKNDKYYLVTLTAKYLEVLHEKHGSSISKIFAFYNCGENNFFYRNVGYVYKYSINGVKNMAHFASMLTAY